MFQLNPELLELTQRYKTLLENTLFKENQNISLYAFGAFVIIGVIFAILETLYTYNIPIYKKEPISEQIYNKITTRFIIIGILLLIFIAYKSNISDRTEKQTAHSVIQEYKIKHEHNNPLKDFDEQWLVKLLTNNKIKAKTLFETKEIAKYFENITYPSVKYIQLEPAPEGDAPVVKTQIITKSDAQKHKNYQTNLPTEDVQLIKIETIDNQTMVTAHLKVKGQSYKVEVSELVLDKMLQSKTAFYYDEEKGKILVGV